MNLLFQFVSNKWHLGAWFSAWFTWFSAITFDGAIKSLSMVVGLIAGVVMLLKLWNEYRISQIELNELKNKKDE